MSTRSASLGSRYSRGEAQGKPEDHQSTGDELKQGAGKAEKFGMRAYHKFANDWTMNLVAMVSYNLLTSFFPLVLALITILALVPPVSNNINQFAAQINSILPAQVSSNLKIDSLLKNVHKAEGILGLVSIVGLLWGGSNLFGAIENAFAVIFRVKTRDFVKQKVMSLIMILLFVVLLPLSFVSSLLLGSTTTSLGRIMPAGLSGPLSLVIGLAAGLTSLFILFLAIYIVVPNLPLSWRHAWRGALAAAVVMWIINTIFPFYTTHFVGTGNYGAAAIGTAIITITWFWFFSLVLLIGAQVNALAMNIGPWPYDLPGMLMRYKVPTTSGEPTGMDAARDEESPEEKRSPLGIARDAQKVENPTGGAPDHKSSTAGRLRIPSNTDNPAGGGSAANQESPAESRKAEQAGRKR